MVTGGAGFLGSNLTIALLNAGHQVVVYDNFSTGSAKWIPRCVEVIQGDLVCIDDLDGCDTVIHLQGHADVRNGRKNMDLDFKQNISTTRAVLSLCSKVKRVIFSSSAAVYGEPLIIPTPETYAPIQTSIYGAHKLACEAMIQAYASYFGFKWNVMRFVSMAGNRYHHGVVADFVSQLKETNDRLKVLGNGLQLKSYLDVSDGVSAIIGVMNHGSGIFNVGHDDALTVKEVAGIVISEMGLRNVAISTGSKKRGWIGDAPEVRLDCSRLKTLGWKPMVSIERAIRNTVRSLLK